MLPAALPCFSRARQARRREGTKFLKPARGGDDNGFLREKLQLYEPEKERCQLMQFVRAGLDLLIAAHFVGVVLVGWTTGDLRLYPERLKPKHVRRAQSPTLYWILMVAAGAVVPLMLWAATTHGFPSDIPD
jgi:hypothetical protein